MSYEGITVLNYRLGRKLGEGGFGVVYAAEHDQLGRQAAVKVLHRDYSKHSELAERFFREARLVCDIGHDAIVEVHNAGTLETGEPFYLMELVEGTALDATVVADGPLSASDALAVFGPIADALGAAHGRGIIHRDLKPSNIMLRRDDAGAVAEVKLLDFGIAKLLDGVDDLSSSTGRMMGTPAYMAPEQARDAKTVDARADVYSFAATIFGALTGRKLFEKTNVAELLLAVQTVPAPRLSRHLTGVPRKLDQALARCLEKERDDRPSTIAEAWSLISAGLRDAGAMTSKSAAQTLPPSEVLAPMASTLTEAASSHAPTTVRKRGPALWAIVVAIAVAVAGAYVVATRLAAEPEGAPDAIARRGANASDAGVTIADAGGATALVADATPPPPPPVDAAPPDARPKPRTSRRRRDRRPPKPPRETAPTPTPTPPPKPALTCTKASFARVWREESPSADEVHAALGRLRKCKEAGELDATRFQQYQRALLRKL